MRGSTSVCCREFRARLVAHDLQGVAFEMLLGRMTELGLVKARGRQRTDATHVVAAVRDLNRLEMVAETVRAALEALAAAAPRWLAGQVDADLVKRYAARIDEWRLPSDKAKRRRLCQRSRNSPPVAVCRSRNSPPGRSRNSPWG